MTPDITYQDNQTASQPMIAKEKHLIEDYNFQKLIVTQEEIYQITQVKPSLKKLVNLIIDQSDLANIRDQLIKQYS